MYSRLYLDPVNVFWAFDIIDSSCVVFHFSILFLQRDDFKRFQIERFLTVQVFQQVAAGDDTPLDADLVCFRGFEAYRSRESLRRYQQGRLAHTACIIQEQGFQRILGLHDPDRLRLLATMKSQSYLQEAQTRAALDEFEVNPKSCLYKNEPSLFSSHSLEVESPAEFVKFEVVTTNCIGTDLSPQQVAIRAAWVFCQRSFSRPHNFDYIHCKRDTCFFKKDVDCTPSFDSVHIIWQTIHIFEKFYKPLLIT